jgi:hypothetical protein
MFSDTVLLHHSAPYLGRDYEMAPLKINLVSAWISITEISEVSACSVGRFT